MINAAPSCVTSCTAESETVESSALSESEMNEARKCKKKGKTRPKGFDASTAPVYDHIFSQAKREKRVILTTSKGMRARAACPESMLVTGQGTNLEESLVELFERYRLPLDRDKFLTVCGKCGGGVVACEGAQYREIVTAGGEKDTEVPWVPEDRQIFMCKDCYQVIKVVTVKTRILSNLSNCSHIGGVREKTVPLRERWSWRMSCLTSSRVASDLLPHLRL